MSRDVESVQRRLGQRLQQLRLERGLTQDELARRCDISQKYLSELERGEKTASFETLVALAHRGFQLRMSALLFEVDGEAQTAPRKIDDVLAGRPEAAQHAILQAIELLLGAGTLAGATRTGAQMSSVTRAAEPKPRRR
jgi:transcriptional regulator with XRE-family HTH domain